MGQRPFHSRTWRPLNWEVPGGTAEGGEMTSRFCQRCHKSRLRVGNQKGLCMIVVSHIMRMPMQGPAQVLRGGSVRLHSFEPFLKWISRSVTPRPGLVATG